MDIDFADQGMGCHFFYFLGEKSPARVAKVPAAILTLHGNCAAQETSCLR